MNRWATIVWSIALVASLVSTVLGFGGWGWLAPGLVLLGGVQLTSMGILGEYLARVHQDEINAHDPAALGHRAPRNPR